MEYRELRQNEIIREGDMFINKKWYPDGIWTQQRGFVGEKVKDNPGQHFRRPQKSKDVSKTPHNKASLKCLCNWVKYRGKYVRRWQKACKVHKQ